MSERFEDVADFVATYDALMLSPFMRELHGQAPNYNVGDWSRGATTLPQACGHLMDRVLAALPVQHGQILDIGSGLGGSTRRLALHCPRARVIGINISPAQIEMAAEHCPEATFLMMDATRLEFADASCSAAISVEAAFHFCTRAAFLREAARVLEPGGFLVLTDMLFGPADWMGAWTVPGENLLPDLPAYARVCSNAGFEVEVLEDITDVSWNAYARYLVEWGEAAAARQEMPQQAVADLRMLAEDLLRADARYVIARLRRR